MKKGDKATEKKYLLISPNEKGKKLISKKINRNGLCTCGSGKKAKKCCGTDTEYYCAK